MTPAQLAIVKVGDNVKLRGDDGRVTQATPRWFMVTWFDGTPQTFRREPSDLVDRMHLQTPRKARPFAPAEPVRGRLPYAD